MLAVGLALGAALLAVIFVPIGFEFDVGGAAPRHLVLSWGFGMVRFDVGKPNRSPASKGPEKSTKTTPGSALRAARAALRALRLPALREALVRLLGRLIGATHPHDVRLHGCVGLDDPCDTGMVWALVGAPLAALASRTGNDLLVVPDFDGPRLSFEGHGRLTIFPGEIVLVLAAFLKAPAVLDAMREVARTMRS